MSKKTIFTILASTIVALGASFVQADTLGKRPVRDGQEYGSADGYDYPPQRRAPVGVALPYRGEPVPGAYPVVRSGYGRQEVAPIVNGTFLRPDGTAIPRGPSAPVYGECQPLPDGLYIVTSVAGAYPIRKYSSPREAALFSTRDLETLIAAGNCKF